MSDAMRWTPDPSADDRPEPLLRIDLTDLDPAGARERVEKAVVDWWLTGPLETP